MRMRRQITEEQEQQQQGPHAELEQERLLRASEPGPLPSQPPNQLHRETSAQAQLTAACGTPAYMVSEM